MSANERRCSVRSPRSVIRGDRFDVDRAVLADVLVPVVLSHRGALARGLLFLLNMRALAADLDQLGQLPQDIRRFTL
jgi:hypothetical protein